MNANQIASLIGLTTQAYHNGQLDPKEALNLTAGLFKTAGDGGIFEETQAAVREFNILNYEAPANG